MPTKEQIATVVANIKDVIGRNYIEGNGDMCSCWFQPEGGGRVGMGLFQGVPVGTPEPFADLPSQGKVELLTTYVDWKGFTDVQKRSVINVVLEGESHNFFEVMMDGIKPSVANPEKEQFKRILEEQTIDYQAARLRDTGQDYEKFLKEATERALDRMQGKEKEGRER
jgi:hypothetical protein